MNKIDIIDFIENIKDCKDVIEIDIKNGIKRDYIDVRYYDEDGVFRSKDGVYIRG